MDDRGSIARGGPPLAPILVAALLATATFAAALAQEVSEAIPEAPVDATGLASGPFARMSMLYERTIFRVDVLRLELRFGPETATALEELAAGRELDDALADRIAETVVASREVLARSRFLRDVSYEQYLDGIRSSMEDARDAGFLTPEEHDRLLPVIDGQYGPIHERGIRDGETIWYRVRGETLHVVLVAEDGIRLVDSTNRGEAHVRALLGGYMAPESDFRQDLIESLFRQGTDRPRPPAAAAREAATSSGFGHDGGGAEGIPTQETS